MNRKRFVSRKKALNIYREVSECGNSDRKQLVSNLMHDFEAHQSDRQSDLDDKHKRYVNAIEKRFKSCLMQCPDSIQNTTISDIIKNGGNIVINQDKSGLRIEISKSLFANKDKMTANKSRQVFNDMSAAINCISSKKKDLLESTNKAMVFNLPLNGSTLNKSPKMGTRLLRSAVKLNANYNNNNFSKPIGSQNRVLRTVEKTRREEVVINDNSIVEETKTSTIVTTTLDSELFKSPFMKSSSMPFLTKPPRKPDSNEDIIVISTSGTPLLVDQKEIKQIIFKSDDKKH